MTVDVNSEDGLIIRKLMPLATLPGDQFNALCAKITVEEIQDGFLFKKGDVSTHLVENLTKQKSESEHKEA